MHFWQSRPAHRRRVNGQRRSLIAVLALVASGLSVGLLNPFAASAAPQAFGMTMVSESGRFMISGNEPGAPLGDPTTVSGTFDPDTGKFSNVSFASPEMHIVQQVTVPVAITVTIDQQLQQLTPGTGQMDENGDVTLDLSFKLHVKIKASIQTGDCYSQPINIQLKSTAPYDPTTGLVNLKAEGFNIPNLETTSACAAIITQNAGAQFAGTNNRLELTLQGDLKAELNESITTLALGNPGPITQGTSTAMTATVTPAEATGAVDFYSGASLLGSATTDANGVATLARALPSGTHQITARYRGNVEYAGSSSAPIEIVVQAKPDFGIAFPATLAPGAAPQVFPVTVTNPNGGVPANLRVDFSIAQTPTDTAASGLNVTPSQLSMEYQDDNGDWVPVGLTQTGTTYAPMTASYGSLTGFALAPGESREVPFRMAAAVGTPKRTLNTTATLKSVDPVTGATSGTVATVNGTTIVPPASRVDAASITLSTLGSTTFAGDSLPRGTFLALRSVIAPAANVAGQPINPAPGGVAEVLVDGIPTPTVAWQDGVAPGGLRIPIIGGNGTANGIPVGSSGFSKEMIDTKDLTTGVHTVQVNYFGDTNYKSGFSQVVNFTVTAAWGKVYTCAFAPPGQSVFRGRALVSGFATLPGAVTSGTTASFSDAEIRIGTSVFPGNTGGQTLNSPLRDLTAQLQPNGTATKLGGSTYVGPSATQNDMRHTFTAATGSSVIIGEPGDKVEVTLDRLDFTNSAIRVPASCEPLGEPASLGSITVAGTKLTVTPGGTSSIGDAITLTAEVKPATGGQVEFFDGDTPLGVVGVTAGKAVLVTGDLSGGTHQLKARHSGGSFTVNGISTSVGTNESNVVEKTVQYTTKTTVTPSATSVPQGPVNLTATVATNPASSAVPVGTVQFKANGNPIGSAVALTNGSAQLTGVNLPAGPSAITASYSGDAVFAASTSAATTVTVGKVVTSIVVAAAQGSVSGVYWKVPNMKATLTSPAGPVVGKSIIFKIGSNTACTAVTNASGVATCAGQIPSLGALFKNTYTATFAGDSTATAVTGTGAMSN